MILFFDGAMGTRLQSLGLSPSECPELWNLTRPNDIIQVQKEYVQAGADILESHTFGAHPIKLAAYGLEDQAEEFVTAAVKNAKIAANGKAKVAGSSGPIGKLIFPLGDLSFEDAYDGYYRIVKAMAQAGADLILFETFIDLQEMRAALLAAKAACDLPVFCQMTYEANGRTVTGTDPATAAIVLDKLGASVIGANCSLGPEQLLEVVKTYHQYTEKPISIQPNAGLPIFQNGETIFPMTPQEMAHWAPKLIEAGASYLGGCCGTTPIHITAMKEACQNQIPPTAKQPAGLWLASRTRNLPLGHQFAPRLIGERINPTGKKALAQSLRDGNLLMVKREALTQIDKGAELLDVNLGVPGLDITELMATVITELSSMVDTPLVIDTTDPAALEAGLRAYPGRALINSVSAEPERIRDFLPLAKKYGAAILCLPLTLEGIPETPEKRLEAAQFIRNAALEAGLTDSDLALDPLVLPVAADGQSARVTLDTLKLFKKELGFPTLMGLSNSSFGLPSRPKLNATFLALALEAGLNAPLANPCDEDLKTAWDAAQVLGGFDPQGLSWSQDYHLTIPASSSPVEVTTDPLSLIRQSIRQGEKEGILSKLESALANQIPPLELAEQGLTTAMTEVGVDFGAGKCFLPQVLMAAETMRIGFDFLKAKLPKEQTAKGKALVATVQGDIHDLGKNIVVALLENSGFEIIDLGKDVSPEEITSQAKKHNPDFIGLCALMTTTLPALEKTITQLTLGGYNQPIMVGGAVLTEEYSEKIGTTYAKDAISALELANMWTIKKEIANELFTS